MPNTHNIKQRDLFILLLVLIVAAIMRFADPGVVEFFHDDAMLSTLAQDMAAGETFPLTGIISSVGIPNPPTSVYVMALPFALDSHPMTAILLIMALNVVGVGLLWLLAHHTFGRTAALVAGLAYAVSPWAVLYSRKIWAQDFHTPFILLAILLGIYGFLEGHTRPERGKRILLTRHEWAQALSLPVLLFGMQIHFAAWLLLPVYLALLWIGRQRISWRALIVTGMLSALVLLPYAAGLLQTLESDPTRITDAADRSEASEGLDLTAQPLTYAAYLTTGTGLETWLQPDQPDALLESVPPLTPIWLLLGIGLLFGIVALWREKRRFLWIVGLWALLPVLAFIPRWTPVYPHYFVASIPALMLLIGTGISWLADRLPSQPHSRTVLLSLLVVILMTQAIWWRGTVRYLDATHIDYPGFTTPLRLLDDIRAELASFEDVVVVSHGMAWNLHHESAVWPVLLRDQVACVRTIEETGYAVLPDQPFAVLIAPDAPSGFARDFYSTDDPVIFPEREGGGEYLLHTFETAPEWIDTPITPIEPATFESDVQLTGYHLGSGQLVLEWRLPSQTKGLDYQYSGQVFNESGERVAQRDTVFWHGRHWCAGDRLVTFAPLDVPEDGYRLSVSLYELGTGGQARQYFPANVLDEMGNPAGQHVGILLNPPSESD